MAKYSNEVIETARGLRLIDDTLFRLVAEDIPACQEILRELLDDDGSSHAKLLQLFLRDDVFEDTDYPAISSRIGYFKGTEEGGEDMCKAVDDLAEKRAKKTKDQMILNLIRKDYPVEDIAEAADVTVEYVTKIRDDGSCENRDAAMS